MCGLTKPSPVVVNGLCIVSQSVALMALKRKKRLEQQLTQIDGTLSTIEFQREALENSHTNTEVLKNMGYASKALENVHKTMSEFLQYYITINKSPDLLPVFMFSLFLSVFALSET